ncbi:MAG: hypothetical protein H7061_07305 [Bdellovibrionaceae bacterium]|nr:hypothetical protein [Bdellovibrio sp.]
MKLNKIILTLTSLLILTSCGGGDKTPTKKNNDTGTTETFETLSDQYVELATTKDNLSIESLSNGMVMFFKGAHQFTGQISAATPMQPRHQLRIELFVNSIVAEKHTKSCSLILESEAPIASAKLNVVSGNFFMISGANYSDNGESYSVFALLETFGSFSNSTLLCTDYLNLQLNGRPGAMTVGDVKYGTNNLISFAAHR